MAERPSIADILRLAWTQRRGSPIDPHMSFPRALLEVKDTAPDSPLTMQELLAREDYRDLRTAKVRPGDPAFDFSLPLLGGGGTFRLSDHREVQPVALIFGSYT